MLQIDVDPQTTITASRPMPDEVLILTCDADGATSWVKMNKKIFGELSDLSLLAILEDSTAHARKNGVPDSAADWALTP